MRQAFDKACGVLALQMITYALFTFQNMRQIFLLLGTSPSDLVISATVAAVGCVTGIAVVAGMGLLATADLDPRPWRWQRKRILLPALLVCFTCLFPAIGTPWPLGVGALIANPVQVIPYFGVFLLMATGEELLSRGVIQTLLLPYGAGRAAVISAFMYGIMHLGAYERADFSPFKTAISLAGVTMLGFGFAVLRDKTKALLPVALLHALWNEFVALADTCYRIGCETWAMAQTPWIRWGLYLLPAFLIWIYALIIWRTDNRHKTQY